MTSMFFLLVFFTLVFFSKKEGKLLVSHRSTDVPLLHSCPGGVEREQIVQDLPECKNTKKKITRLNSPKF